MHRTLTLALDDAEIPIQVFYAKIGNFLGLLREVDRSLSSEARDTAQPWQSVRWVIQDLRGGSAIVSIRPEVLIDDPDIADRVVTALTDGLKRLNVAEPVGDLPPHFTYAALREVWELTRFGRDGVGAVTISSEDAIVTLTSWAEANADRFIRPRFASPGTVEGILQMVSVTGGAHFHVRDHLTGRSIHCTVPPEKLGDVVSVFNRRVIVSGELQTNERGDVLRIHMAEIAAIPDESELPSTEEIAGSIDITRGKSVREHLSSLRDAS